MVVLPDSQAVPLPNDLPFRIVSRTIGQGAYAFIRRAVPPHSSTPVIAVKFINKEHAFNTGRLRPKQLQMEILLHQHLGKHRNVIEFLGSGESPAYQWIAMELADGGDLFDKIEADVGVGEDISHFYFTQLMSAVSYMHSKGVAHRDIKPENILLSKDGDLKVADFGLAALFRKDTEIRLCNTVCGSPPYIAPEVVAGKRVKRENILESGYAPNVADIWSCGVVLFVLLVGNTPWDEPTMKSYEFKEYVETSGRTSDELWHKLSPGVQSLLRGMLKLDPKERFALEEVRRHPWFTRPNSYLSSTGAARDPIALATKLIEGLHIDVDAEPTISQRTCQPGIERMEIDADDRIAFTQPETPLADASFEWERPPRFSLGDGVSASQPVRSRASTRARESLLDHLADDPSMSQFSQTPSVPLSLTQAAKRFGDIVPAHSLARFLSTLPLSLLLPLIVEALHRLGIPATPVERTDQAYVKIKTIDGRQQGLVGTVVIEKWNEEDVFEVRFVKAKGDPIEWRRFFKRIVALCKDAVLIP